MLGPSIYSRDQVELLEALPSPKSTNGAKWAGSLPCGSSCYQDQLKTGGGNHSQPCSMPWGRMCAPAPQPQEPDSLLALQRLGMLLWGCLRHGLPAPKRCNWCRQCSGSPVFAQAACHPLHPPATHPRAPTWPFGHPADLGLADGAAEPVTAPLLLHDDVAHRAMHSLSQLHQCLAGKERERKKRPAAAGGDQRWSI